MLLIIGPWVFFVMSSFMVFHHLQMKMSTSRFKGFCLFVCFFYDTKTKRKLLMFLVSCANVILCELSNRIMNADLKFPSKPEVSAEAKDFISKVSSKTIGFHFGLRALSPPDTSLHFESVAPCKRLIKEALSSRSLETSLDRAKC